MAKLPERQIVAIDKLHPAAYNPRKDLKRGDPEYDHLANSIEAFGYIEPIVWNKRTGNVVGGHQRLNVLIEQGETEAEVVVVDYDEITEKAANLALNKIRGDWEFEKLADLLNELDTGAFDMELTGFQEGDIKNIMEWSPEQESREVAAPESFKEYGEDIETEYCCPKCGYEWSGKPKNEQA